MHIIPGLSTGGAEMMLFKLVRSMDRDSFIPIIISLKKSGSLRKKFDTLDIQIYSLDFNKGISSVSSFIQLFKIVRDLKPQIIQGWMYKGNAVATIVWYINKKSSALVWNIRQSLYRFGNENRMTRLIIKINRLFSLFPDTIIYNSTLSCNHHSVFGFKSFNSMIIPNGFDIQEFCYSDKQHKDIRSNLNIPQKAIVVGHVARLHPMKDHPLFLRAAVELAKSFLNIHIIHIGQGISLKNKGLSSLIPAEIHNRFHLLNERDNVSELMCAMDIFCQSSWAEAFPNVLGEAMSIGVPCVATDVGDSANIVGETGVMVPSRNEKALFKGLETLLMISNAQRKALGIKARNRIKSNYELNVIVINYIELYEKLINNKKTPC